MCSKERTISETMRAQDCPTRETPKIKRPYPSGYSVIDREALTEREVIQAVQPDPDLAVLVSAANSSSRESKPPSR